MTKAVLLDLDDTLWDFRTNAAAALRQTYGELQLSRCFSSFESFFEAYSGCNHHLWELYSQGRITKEYLSLHRFLHPLTEAGCHDEDLAMAMSESFLSNSARQTRLVDGAIGLLEYLRPKYTLAVASNGFTEVQSLKIERSGLAPYFSHIFLSEHIGFQKPHSRFFSHILSAMRLDPSQLVMVGDNYQTDILGAIAADIQPIYFNPLNIPVPSEPKIHHIVAKLSQIRGIL